MIGIPALAVAAGLFGYGIWMVIDADPDDSITPEVEGIIQEPTTTAPDAFEEPETLPGVDPEFDDSTGTVPEVEIGTAVSIVRDEADVPTTAPE